MDTPKAKQLIKQGITELLEQIDSGTYPYWNADDLAEERQLNDDMVFDYLEAHYPDKLYEVGVDTEDDIATDNFTERIIDVLNGEWYQNTYHKAVERARQGIQQEQELQYTNKSLMPTWRP